MTVLNGGHPSQTTGPSSSSTGNGVGNFPWPSPPNWNAAAARAAEEPSPTAPKATPTVKALGETPAGLAPKASPPPPPQEPPKFPYVGSPAATVGPPSWTADIGRTPARQWPGVVLPDPAPVMMAGMANVGGVPMYSMATPLKPPMGASPGYPGGGMQSPGAANVAPGVPNANGLGLYFGGRFGGPAAASSTMPGTVGGVASGWDFKNATPGNSPPPDPSLVADPNMMYGMHNHGGGAMIAGASINVGAFEPTLAPNSGSYYGTTGGV